MHNFTPGEQRNHGQTYEKSRLKIAFGVSKAYDGMCAAPLEGLKEGPLGLNAAP